MNQLEILRKITSIVLDSGDYEYIKKFSPEDVTTNPSLILKILKSNKYNDLIENSINYSILKGGNFKSRLENVVDKFIVNIGTKILKYIPGKISTEIDAKFSFNTKNV